MSKKLYEEANIQDIANAIREKNGTQDSYTVTQMGDAVRAIHAQPNLESLRATENKTYWPSNGKDGFSNVIVDVQNTFGPNDNGKVVNNGSLSAQTSRTLSANGTFDTTFNNSVIIDVSASINLQSKTVSENGTVEPDDGYDGLSQVIVNVFGGEADKHYAIRVWTKSIGGNDAALYIQRGIVESGTFIEDEEPITLRYQDASSPVDYDDFITIRYGTPSWHMIALSPVMYNDDSFEINDEITSWTYGTSFDGIIIDPNIIGQTFIDLSIAYNGTYLPESYHADAFSEVVVNVPQSTDTGLIDGTTKIIQNPASSIREYCMYRYSSLTEAGFPNCVTIGDSAFANCSSLSTISFPSCETIGKDAFYACRSLLTASFPSCVSIGDSAFANCSSLSTISFPSCETIGKDAFYACRSLLTASFPSCVSIGDSAFVNCSSLTTAFFPNCETIGNNAFYACRSLSTISFPSCVSIGYAFQYCSSLTTAFFPNCISIANYAFVSCSSLTTASFPSCETIGSYAFQYCSSLTTAFFPNCETIGNNAFYACRSLSTISFPMCRTVSAHAFDACRNLSSVELPLCETIQGSAFQSCSELQRATFPACKRISAYAFVYDKKLTSLYLLSTSVVTLDNSAAFIQTPMQYSSYIGVFGSIFVPASLVDAYKSAPNWSYFSDRIAAYTGE